MQIVDRVGRQRQFGKDDQVDPVIIRLARQIEHGLRIGLGIPTEAVEAAAATRIRPWVWSA